MFESDCWPSNAITLRSHSCGLQPKTSSSWEGCGSWTVPRQSTPWGSEAGGFYGQDDTCGLGDFLSALQPPWAGLQGWGWPGSVGAGSDAEESGADLHHHVDSRTELVQQWQAVSKESLGILIPLIADFCLLQPLEKQSTSYLCMGDEALSLAAAYLRKRVFFWCLCFPLRKHETQWKEFKQKSQSPWTPKASKLSYFPLKKVFGWAMIYNATHQTGCIVANFVFHFLMLLPFFFTLMHLAKQAQIRSQEKIQLWVVV